MQIQKPNLGRPPVMMTTLSRKRFCCEEEDIFYFSNLEIEIDGVNKEVKGKWEKGKKCRYK
jgi:hypothetical protein